MKRYQHSKEDRDSSEKIGFYVALTICMAAVGLAIWSAYSTINDAIDEGDSGYVASLSTATEPVGQHVTGMTEAEASVPTTGATQAPTAAPTEPATQAAEQTPHEDATVPRADQTELQNEISSLQAVLRVTDSLIYPVRSRSVLKQYSESAVLSKTMHDYRAHTGCDFAAAKGESVYAMCAGKVKDISVSELYGVILEVESDGFSVYYCGLDPDIVVAKGASVKTGDTVGTVGQIPCESADESHIHVEIRVGTRLIDPLSVINSNS